MIRKPLWESKGASEAANTLPEDTAQRGVKVGGPGGSEGSLEARGSACLCYFEPSDGVGEVAWRVLGGGCKDREGGQVSQDATQVGKTIHSFTFVIAPPVARPILPWVKVNRVIPLFTNLDRVEVPISALCATLRHSLVFLNRVLSGFLGRLYFETILRAPLGYKSALPSVPRTSSHIILHRVGSCPILQMGKVKLNH